MNSKVFLKVADLEPNTWNPNVMGDVNKEAMRKDIKECGGCLQDVIVRKHPTKQNKYEIIDGEHRWRIHKEEKIDTIPCIIEDLDDAKARLRTIKMNKFRGEFDKIKLAELFISLRDDHQLTFDFIASELGYTPTELEGLEELIKFDWEDYKEEDIPNPEEEANPFKQIEIKCLEAEYADIMEAINLAKEKLGVDTDGTALQGICNDFTTKYVTKE